MVRSTDSSEHERKNENKNEPSMRVGDNYQAVVPDVVKESYSSADDPPEPLLVWAPCEKIADNKMDEFLNLAKDKYGYNMEQSLGMLYWHKYDIEKATEDLQNFTPLPDEWSMEDKVVFDQSFHSYGKSFPRIRQQLPDKSIGSLVRYYYSWKKSRNKKSLMDKNEKKAMSILNGIFGDDGGDMDNDSSDSDYEPTEKKSKTKSSNEKASNSNNSNQESNKPSPVSSSNCVNCAGMTPQMTATARGKMCVPCHEYWRRTGDMRPKDKENMTSFYHGPQHKLKRKPPKGIQLNQESLMEVAQAHGDAHIRPLEVDLINLKRQILTDKEIIFEQNSHLESKINKYRPPDMSQQNNPRWANEELLIAVQCVRTYGKDFQAMAEVLGNKSSAQCRSFFINYRHRYNLLEVLAEYEKLNNIPRHESQLNEDDSNDVENNDVTSHETGNPPQLRRQNSKGTSDTNKSVQGPPPLVNNTTTAITSAAG